MKENLSLFDDSELPLAPSYAGKDFKSLQYPVWSEGKAKLIQEYLKLFTFITRHGCYIDGFAAPQRRDIWEICSAKLVLETEPKWLRDFWLCDIDPKGVNLLEELASAHRVSKRRVSVLNGDFNKTVDTILDSGRIKASTATFALLDQRTFECHWETVRRLAEFKSKIKSSSSKIEIFYFFATGWLDRSIAAVRRPETSAKLDKWWGNSDWANLRGQQSIRRAFAFADRFKTELKYKYARPYAIHNRKRLGRTMYHMIHATDHDQASPLMLRAYRKISGRSDIEMPNSQIDMDSFWNNPR